MTDTSQPNLTLANNCMALLLICRLSIGTANGFNWPYCLTWHLHKFWRLTMVWRRVSGALSFRRSGAGIGQPAQVRDRLSCSLVLDLISNKMGTEVRDDTQLKF